MALGSGSSQEYVGNQLYGNRATTSQQSSTEVLKDGMRRSDNAARVNLSFGLCSGSSSAATHTVLVNPHPDDDAGQVTAVGRSAKAPSGEWVAAKKTRERLREQSPASSVPRAAASRPNWMQPPSPLSGGGSKGGCTAACVPTDEDFSSGLGEWVGRKVWAEHQQQVRREREVSITPWVQRLRVRKVMTKKEPAVVDADDYDDTAEDDERQDKETGGVHLFQGESGKHDFFQLTGKERSAQGFNFTMDRAVYEEIKGSTVKSRTIHPKNVADTGGSRGVQLPSGFSGDLQSVGDGDAGADGNDEDESSTKGSSPATGNTGGCGKRKNVRKQTFESLTECMEKHGTLMATMMESASKRQTVAAAAESPGEGDVDEPLVNRQRRGAARDGIEAAMKLWVGDMRFWNETEGNGLFKLIREVRLYLLAIARGVATPEIRRSIALPHSSIPQHKIGDESQLKAANGRAIKVQGITWRVIHRWIVKSASRSRGYHSAYGYVLNHVTTDIARIMWLGDDWCTCVSPVVCHITLEMDMKLPVWFVGAHIEDKHEDGDLVCYQEATMQHLVIHRSITLPHSSILQHKIGDESQLKAAKDRAIKVQSITWCVIHGWIFTSASRSRGYHSAYGYVLNHLATDIARVIWLGDDWCTGVSPAVCHITLEMDMKLPVWFVDAHIEDRYEDGELACYQEATMQRLVGAFTSVVSLAEGIDSGRISYDGLRNIADAMRLLLVASTWLMRMSGDDLHSHFNASLFVQLTATPTLMAAMHWSFDACRHILQAVTVVTERMGKPAMTLADPPLYIPYWDDCGITFSHETTLPSPMAVKLEWLGTGLPEDDDDKQPARTRMRRGREAQSASRTGWVTSRRRGVFAIACVGSFCGRDAHNTTFVMCALRRCLLCM
ncbi:hypothetical protein CBR_g28481 [Chara braunii]|uniref:Uncharacterized protein n=1 Tax=Chara braunii TaxID=69332 RepID=A0A388JW47_CHABU|nr:hypothetical protein CBR_g28481 [Chara braunii]|eukprot:GBG62005.1 hypothetical protein CBR_g28481 [Chara braunii]